MTEQTEITACGTWEEMITNEDILRSIFSFGFEKPSPIQGRAIPIIAKGRDIIAQAQSGTGKTAAFSVGALTRIDFAEKNTQALIIAPTHELACDVSLAAPPSQRTCEPLRPMALTW